MRKYLYRVAAAACLTLGITVGVVPTASADLIPCGYYDVSRVVRPAAGRLLVHAESNVQGCAGYTTQAMQIRIQKWVGPTWPMGGKWVTVATGHTIRGGVLQPLRGYLGIWRPVGAKTRWRGTVTVSYNNGQETHSTWSWYRWWPVI